jgi:hypothetical protein
MTSSHTEYTEEFARYALEVQLVDEITSDDARLRLCYYHSWFQSFLDFQRDHPNPDIATFFEWRVELSWKIVMGFVENAASNETIDMLRDILGTFFTVTYRIARFHGYRDEMLQTGMSEHDIFVCFMNVSNEVSATYDELFDQLVEDQRKNVVQHERDVVMGAVDNIVPVIHSTFRRRVEARCQQFVELVTEQPGEMLRKSQIQGIVEDIYREVVYGDARRRVEEILREDGCAIPKDLPHYVNEACADLRRDIDTMVDWIFARVLDAATKAARALEVVTPDTLAEFSQNHQVLMQNLPQHLRDGYLCNLKWAEEGVDTWEHFLRYQRNLFVMYRIPLPALAAAAATSDAEVDALSASLSGMGHE